MSSNGRRVGLITFCALLTGSALVSSVYATAVPQSTNYRFDESAIGNSSLLESSSTNFKGTSSVGDTATGPSASTNFQTEAGSKTTPDPNLTVAVDTFNANFGSFSATTAATATATFTVMNYTSYGYVVQIIGESPKHGSHSIAEMSATAVSQPGIEQFGVNLVANTSPISYGANPDNGSFGFGAIAGNYSTPNQFRFVSGETIAQAPKSSGKTLYTLSYLVNVSSLTPGGVYASDQTLIVTGTY